MIDGNEAALNAYLKEQDKQEKNLEDFTKSIEDRLFEIQDMINEIQAEAKDRNLEDETNKMIRELI